MAQAMELKIDWPPAGRYVVAVSGGADSMVLMDLMAGAASERGYELAVAHFDHGMRPESAADARFVEAAAARLGLEFVTRAAALGRTSEAAARAARYAWLEEVRGPFAAAAILTAHHQDDLLETSLLNLARGSGRLGLAPMQPGGRLLRPLLKVSRAGLRTYAKTHNLAWREDPTNADTGNARNLLRHRLLPASSPEWRARYLELINELAGLNKKIAQSISVILKSAHTAPDTFDFDLSELRALSDAEIAEVLMAAARTLCPGLQLDQPLLAGAVRLIRTGTTGKRRPLRLGLVLQIMPGLARLTTNPAH